jgi:hypothetical protein
VIPDNDAHRGWRPRRSAQSNAMKMIIAPKNVTTATASAERKIERPCHAKAWVLDARARARRMDDSAIRAIRLERSPGKVRRDKG